MFCIRRVLCSSQNFIKFTFVLFGRKDYNPKHLTYRKNQPLYTLKKMRNIVLLLIFFAFAFQIFGRTIYTECDGEWNDHKIWKGGIVPTTGDSIYVTNNVLLVSDLFLYSNYLNIASGYTICGNYNLYIHNTSTVIIDGDGKFNKVTIYGNLTVNGSLLTKDLIFSYGSTTVNGIVRMRKWNGICSPITNPCYLPVADFTVSDTVICEGDYISFFDNSKNYPSNWQWQFKGSTTPVSNLENPQDIYFPLQGVYDVMLVASNKQGSDTITKQIRLTVVSESAETIFPVECQYYTSPSGKYIWTTSGVYTEIIPNAAGCDSTITIDLKIQNSFSSINVSSCESYTSPSGRYIWTDSGNYSDTIQNNAGCDSIITVGLSILGCQCFVFVPNCFTPNNDGRNEYFIPYSNCELLEYEFIVLNKRGEVMFHTHDVYKGWDGRWNGNKLPMGIFIYRVKYKSEDTGIVEFKYGDVWLQE